MRVKIGKYVNYIGPYQISEYLCFWAKKHTDEYGFKRAPDWVHDFGTWLAEDKHGNDSWLTRVCQWIESKRKRVVKVKIDSWDTWSMDNTLSHIIHPMLVQLKETKQGSPLVDDVDVPDNLKSTSAAPKENDWDTDSLHHDRWDWVLDELIWAFHELKNDCPTEETFYDHSEVDRQTSISEQIKNIKVDNERLKAYNDRMQNAFKLFGKYYRNLWS